MELARIARDFVSTLLLPFWTGSVTSLEFVLTVSRPSGRAASCPDLRNGSVSNSVKLKIISYHNSNNEIKIRNVRQ